MTDYRYLYKEIKQIDADFNRNLWCILGLPFDAINMEQTIKTVLSAAEHNRRCFISTPNLNFLVGTQSDQDFRQSVINSDLSLVDGAPIVAIARLLNIPIPERVSGSNLIERMYARSTTQPLRVYFFGGNQGVGEQACKRINQSKAGIVAVGFYDPGFVSIESMSTDVIIDEINRHESDFVIVSLGGKKGQAWIEANRHKLKAPIISHLGAVINFSAGTIKRSPEWMQKVGLEWCWRIYQEPYLWQRYYNDGRVFLRLLLGNVLPYWIWQKKHPIDPSKITSIDISTEDNTNDHTITVNLSGDCDYRTVSQVKEKFRQLSLCKKNVTLNLESVPSIDSAFLGQCLILIKYLNLSNHNLKIVNANKTVKKILHWCKMEHVL